MKIKSMLMMVSAIAVILFVINSVSLGLLVMNTKQQVQAFQKENTVLQLKEQLVMVSDYLTTEARAYVSTGDKAFYEAYMREVNDTQTYAKVIAEFEKILPDDILTIVHNVQSESGQLAQIEAQGFQLMQQGNQQAAIDMMYDDNYFAGKNRINDYLQAFNDEVSTWVDELSTTAKNGVTMSIVILISSVVISSLFSIIASILIISKFKPLFAVIQQIEEVADGNLMIQPLTTKEGAKDEISQLSIAFNTMFGNLKNTIVTVNDASMELSASTEQLSVNVSQSTDATERVTEATDGIAGGAQTQLEQIQESSQAMMEVAQGIQHIASAASDVATSSTEVSKQADEGGQGLQHAIEQMQEVDVAVNEAMSSIESLSTQSREIENIVETITGIADQTNLLALNAAIEAARAGESGKGFAVVADEVRKLAEQSNQSAKQIATIIHMIQGDMQTTVQQMNKVNDKVSIGTQSITHTGTSFATIIQAIQTVTNQIQEVSAVSEQMAASAQQVSATFDSLQVISRSSTETTQHVASLSEEQLASMEEIASATQMLNQLAMNLNNAVGKFKLL
ncbi:methyl-accepting chemotaxis protein [Metasolibacillus sp.]|uniref:methyl-accepting chemotaxis protein n=1 Tax=Metasolibacillus sp. TaxID=2703680 RepID=UPI0025DF1AA2|nr:methyl-accepting chemotaxis protein [Metasolibacillus sp.]MCT6925206.1 methyl-accepting chemotaxis protein [Metasolibacillus sp.]MCT6941436.1 methyl-accepting chemotaxis protein [Metasolibacillus sp.]